MFFSGGLDVVLELGANADVDENKGTEVMVVEERIAVDCATYLGACY